MVQTTVVDCIAVESSIRGKWLLPVWDHCCEKALFCPLGCKILHTIFVGHMFSTVLCHKANFLPSCLLLVEILVLSHTVCHVKFLWSDVWFVQCNSVLSLTRMYNYNRDYTLTKVFIYAEGAKHSFTIRSTLFCSFFLSSSASLRAKVTGDWKRLVLCVSAEFTV